MDIGIASVLFLFLPYRVYVKLFVFRSFLFPIGFLLPCGSINSTINLTAIHCEKCTIKSKSKTDEHKQYLARQVVDSSSLSNKSLCYNFNVGKQWKCALNIEANAECVFTWMNERRQLSSQNGDLLSGNSIKIEFIRPSVVSKLVHHQITNLQASCNMLMVGNGRHSQFSKWCIAMVGSCVTSLQHFVGAIQHSCIWLCLQHILLTCPFMCVCVCVCVSQRNGIACQPNTETTILIFGHSTV